MSDTVKPEDLAGEIAKIYLSYTNVLQGEVYTAVESAAKKAAADVRALSPVATAYTQRKLHGKVHKAGSYKRGWRVAITATKTSATARVHNTHYRLTHLLENGHDIVKHGKVVGHAAAHEHISTANDNAQKDLEKRLIAAVDKATEREASKT